MPSTNACMYSCSRVSSPVCTLHTAITHVSKVEATRELKWELAPETLQFQYYNHVSDCSVQGASGITNPEMNQL